jgi:hypothetical protein
MTNDPSMSRRRERNACNVKDRKENQVVNLVPMHLRPLQSGHTTHSSAHLVLLLGRQCLHITLTRSQLEAEDRGHAALLCWRCWCWDTRLLRAQRRHAGYEM